MTCETLKSSVREGLEFALAMVAAADETLSAAEEAEINRIVDTPFFVNLAAKFNIAPSDLATAIIDRAKSLIAADSETLYDLVFTQAQPAITKIVQLLDDDGRTIILASINSLAESDELSPEESEIIEFIINAINNASAVSA